MSELTTATLGVGEDDLVTGEAVALNLPPASLGLRVLSALIDFAIVGAANYLLFNFVMLASTQFDNALTQGLAIIGMVGACIGYPVAMETLTKGRTVGKLALGLRTVRDDAGPITFRHALTRGLMGFIELYSFWGIPALIAAAINSRSKRIGDVAAGTYVVRERVTIQLPPPVPMPAHLARWAVSADIARLPDHLAMQVRTFLPSAFTMTPHVRAAMGQELLEEVMLYVSPPPPPGNHPEYILAAVVADRRRRDLERLHRDAVLRERLIPGDLADRPSGSVPPTPPVGYASPVPPVPPGWPVLPGSPTVPTAAPNHPVSGYQPVPVDSTRSGPPPPPWGGGNHW